MNTFEKPVHYVLHFKKYTLSLKFVPAQVRGNNHWRMQSGTTKNFEFSHPAEREHAVPEA